MRTLIYEPQTVITRQFGTATTAVPRKSQRSMPVSSDPTCSRRSRSGMARTMILILLGIGIVCGLVFLARNSAAELAAWETWITGLGTEGWLVFVVAAIVLMAVFVPSTVLGAIAGALFGLGWGILAMSVAGLTTAALTWLIAHSLLRHRIAVVLRRYPKLEAIQRAVRSDGMRLQFLFRLAPISPVTVNYVLGAAGVRFLPFMVGALGMLPSFFVEVYFGHLARHVSTVVAGSDSGSTLGIVMKVGGFVTCVVAIIALGKMARNAVAEAEKRAGDPPSGDSGKNIAAP